MDKRRVHVVLILGPIDEAALTELMAHLAQAGPKPSPWSIENGWAGNGHNEEGEDGRDA